MEKEDKKYAPILPFDITFGESFTTYDNQVYHQDLEYITPDKVKMESGNVIKYYRCNDNQICRIGTSSSGTVVQFEAIEEKEDEEI